MKMSNSDPDPDDYVETFEELVDVMRRNMDLFDRLVDGLGQNMDSFDMTDGEPLKKMIKDEDKVEVVIEVEGDNIGEVGFKPVDGGVVLGIGDKMYKVLTPSDVIVEDSEATLKNGILTVEMPRGDDEVLSDVIEKDISMERKDDIDDGDDDGDDSEEEEE